MSARGSAAAHSLLSFAFAFAVVAAAAEPSTLREEIGAMIGEEFAERFDAAVPRFAEELRTTFEALPRAASGGDAAMVVEPAARYALHRLFLRDRGWHVASLHPTGDGSDSELLAKLEEPLQRRLQEAGGVELEDMAVHAALVETCILSGYAEHLEMIYRALGLSTHDPISRQQALRVLSALSVVMMHNMGAGGIDAASLARGESALNATPQWHLIGDCFADLAERGIGDRDELWWQDMGEGAASIVGNFHQCQSQWCGEVRRGLLGAEDPQTPGRLPLPKFYADVVVNVSGLTAPSPEYLKAEGSLDFSDPSTPRIIIPNFLRSDANCLFFDDVLGVHFGSCCPDTCEEKLLRLEAAVGVPSAPADAILREAEAMLSGDVPEVLARKLREVEVYHGGGVPLHGPALAQWLHAVFPADCRYPHGITASEELADAAGVRNVGAAAELGEYLRAAEAEAAGGDGEDGAGSGTACEEAPESECAWGSERRILAEEFVSPHAALLLPKDPHPGTSSWWWPRLGRALSAVAVAVEVLWALKMFCARAAAVLGKRGKPIDEASAAQGSFVWATV